MNSTEKTLSPPSRGCPRQAAEKALAAARNIGDCRREAVALADLGIMDLYEGNLPRAVKRLEEALVLLHQSGEHSWEADLLGHLGLATTAAGQHESGLAILEQELSVAQSAFDRLAEKRALGHLGITYSRLRDARRALDFFTRALILARDLGDWQDEAELLWYTAIQHAALGDQEAAIGQAHDAVGLLDRKGKPQAAWFAHHLHAYCDGTDSSGRGKLATTNGPRLLDLAFSAGKSMIRFLGSGFKTATSQTRDSRLLVCSTCEHHTGLRCRVCRCFTSAKAALAHEECPIGKWPV
jgi:tetratricopeptide (TPR) repeat protein